MYWKLYQMEFSMIPVGCYKIRFHFIQNGNKKTQLKLTWWTVQNLFSKNYTFSSSGIFPLYSCTSYLAICLGICPFTIFVSRVGSVFRRIINCIIPVSISCMAHIILFFAGIKMTFIKHVISYDKMIVSIT